MNGTKDPAFDELTPELVMDAVEAHTGLFLDGTLTPYNSYVNRVFGITDEDENRYIVKFYRPGRWSREAILEEHEFLADCAEAEIPVVLPMPAAGSGTGSRANLSSHASSTLGESDGFLFSVFPRVRGRTFDIVDDGDWERVGRVIGRLHRVGRIRQSPVRLRLTPQTTTARYIAELTGAKLDAGIPAGTGRSGASLVHPDCADDFSRVCGEALSLIEPLFDKLPASAMQRIHGDCHRGNMLETSIGAGNADGDRAAITLIDFDDMMTGPAIQDLWLLLPGRLSDSRRELNEILAGYEEFSDFDRSTIALVEPLRFMRHVYFLAWCAIQRNDIGFAERNPGWGSRAFWITETEDLSTQLDVLKAEADAR